MQPCSSAPITSRPVGKPFNPSLTPGQTIHLRIFRTMQRAEAAPPQLTSCWHAMGAPGDRWTEPATEVVMMPKISLVLADVDGTLVNEEKVLTKRAQNAVSQLRRAGIRFAITSGRPPLGMA